MAVEDFVDRCYGKSTGSLAGPIFGQRSARLNWATWETTSAHDVWLYLANGMPKPRRPAGVKVAQLSCGKGVEGPSTLPVAPGWISEVGKLGEQVGGDDVSGTAGSRSCG